MQPQDICNIVSSLSKVYFEEIPQDYRTYCVLTSQVTQDVLRYFDIPSFLLPCQIWCATPRRNYIIGFSGVGAKSNKWDGHIVCCTEDHLIDAAVSNFTKQFSIATPNVVVARRFHFPSHTLARLDLTDDQRLWWQEAPTGAERYPHFEDMKMVKQLASGLIERLRQCH